MDSHTTRMQTAAVVDGRPDNQSGPPRKTATISAIIPYYNGSRYIADAVRSVAAQTIPPIELIIVDDGSPDGGPAPYIGGIEAPFPIRIVRKENGGQASARNFGARISRGEFLAFLDQDDLWYPNHLRRLVGPLLREPLLGWVYSNLDEIDERGRLIRIGFLDVLPVPHPKRSLHDMLSADCFILPSASLIRRTAFEQVGGFDEQFIGYEDDDLFVRIFHAGWHNTYLNEPLSQWRLYRGSTSYTEKMARSRDRYAQKLLDAFPNDKSMQRWWVRDCIAPRFFNNAMGRFFEGISLGDWELCRVAVQDMRRWAQYYDPGRRARMRLPLMAYPRIYARLSAVKRSLPAFARRWLA
jgi:glycosyltransferase involved in cell wall biosynthesis